MMKENSVRHTLRFSPSPESVGKTFAHGDEPPDFYMTYEQVQTGVVVKLDLWPGHMVSLFEVFVTLTNHVFQCTPYWNIQKRS